jgi:2-polyprenyl-3-methyl-5-hydroxy-6-metoxy-1,4-benzoquinol methylase
MPRSNELLIAPGKSAAFYDRIAGEYEQQLGGPSDLWVRAAFWEFVEARLSPRRTILDFGCGTGHDAVHYASRGHRVLAYDNSAGMVDELRRKHLEQVARGEIDAWSCPYEDVASTLHSRAPIHAVTANFAVVNHLPDVDAWLQMLAGSTTPDSRVFVSSLNACYLPELRRPAFWMRFLRYGREPGVPVAGPDHDHMRYWPWGVGRRVRGFQVASRAGVGGLVFRGSGNGVWDEPRSVRERVERVMWRRTAGWAFGRFTFVGLRRTSE